MTRITLGLDRLNSLLMTYHILNAPTQLSRQYNEAVFKHFQVTPEERGQYLSFWISEGIPLDGMDFLKCDTLFFPDVTTLEDLFSVHVEGVPETVRTNIRAFEPKFNEYFDALRKTAEPFVEQKRAAVQSVADNMYDTAKNMTGMCIERPEDIDVRIVEGMAPASFGSDMEKGKLYIVTQTCHILDPGDGSLKTTVVHEAIGHQTVETCRPLFDEVIGKWFYPVEEGFVKYFSEKIMETYGIGVDYQPGGLEGVAFRIFADKWDEMTPVNFREWYRNRLVEIKSTGMIQ